MVEPPGRHIVRSFQKTWRANALLSNVLLSLACAIFAAAVLYKTAVPPWWSLAVAVVCFGGFMAINRSWQVSEWEVSRFLNRMFPQLEESSGLVLKPGDSLNFLEKLQVDKMNRLLAALEKPRQLNKAVRSSSIVFLVTLVFSALITIAPFSFKNISDNTFSTTSKVSSRPPARENLPASLNSVSVQIKPPGYTGRPMRTQNGLNLQVEEGAGLTWKLRTTMPVKELGFIFNDSTSLKLQPLNDEKTLWSAGKVIRHAGFYQVNMGGKLSDLYKIETIKDEAPVIHIQSPKPYVTIDIGRPAQLTLDVSLTDDYSVTAASIAATIASGSGEAVKFQEQKIPFANFSPGSRQYRLQKLLNLPLLGLKPGDELYYYVIARDNHGQENRSDIYIVSLPDTAQLMSMEGMTTGVNLVPEYFRSQRQIIIETEQLLKEKDTISVTQFNNRSNNLGIDQKLLRLRYGKFLGEESENEIGGDHGHEEGEHDHAEEAQNNMADFGNAEKIMDAFTHKHDNAEDATFFEPELKAQLKATLNEMWKSELQLRTYKPRDALPYEYKALRLLKDLQQKSRVYVAKTSAKTPPLKPEKRLTGELDKIIEPVMKREAVKKPDPSESLRKAIGYLELLKSGSMLSDEETGNLQQAGRLLGNIAADRPAAYLAAVSAMRRIIANTSKPASIKTSDIALVENALQKYLQVSAALPGSPSSHPDLNLSQEYFKNLNKLSQ